MVLSGQILAISTLVYHSRKKGLHA